MTGETQHERKVLAYALRQLAEGIAELERINERWKIRSESRKRRMDALKTENAQLREALER